MQIYGILLNIRGILLNIRGILLKNREKQRISEKFIPQHPDFMLYNIFHADSSKISRFFFGGSNYSSYFCHRL